VQPTKSRDTSVDHQQQQRYGASAYIDQSEYNSYKQPTSVTKQVVDNGTAYSNYTQSYTNDYNKTRQVHNQDTIDDDYSNDQQSYTKPSSTAYPGIFERSNSYNGLQATQGQPRVTSGKQRNPTTGSALYQVIIYTMR
jgi:hypothetical protein